VSFIRFANLSFSFDHKRGPPSLRTDFGKLIPLIVLVRRVEASDFGTSSRRERTKAIYCVHEPCRHTLRLSSRPTPP
jgi:hypothetical protein